MKRPLLTLLAIFPPSLMARAPGTSPGQDLFTPADHLWITAASGFGAPGRTYRLADLDGDGYAEYAVHGGATEGSLAPGWIRIMDGRSGLIRQEWVGNPQPTNCPYQVTTGEYYGSVGAALDLNGDGLHQEVVAGA